MRDSTRAWLEFLATSRNNTKAKEIIAHMKDIEAKQERPKTILPSIEQLARVINSDAYTVADTLYDRGLITEEQFTAIKQGIFGVFSA